MVSFGSDMHTTHSLVFSSLEKTANKNTIINPGNDGGRAVASLVKIKRGRKRRKNFLFFFQEKNTHASSGLVPAVGSGDCSIPKISCKMYTTPSTYEQPLSSQVSVRFSNEKALYHHFLLDNFQVVSICGLHQSGKCRL